MLMQTRAFVLCRRHLHNSNRVTQYSSKKLLISSTCVFARFARSVDSCRTFSQRGQERTQTHLNSTDILRVCVCKCSANMGIMGICACEVLCSQTPSVLTTGFKTCQPILTLYAWQKKGFRVGGNTEHYSF